MTQVFITNTALTSWNTPADWNTASNTIECIGGGAGPSGVKAGGGGGGAYSTKTSFPSAGTISIAVGTGGTNAAGGDTVFNGTSLGSCFCGAQGGSLNSTTTGGVGGSAASSVGTAVSGGSGGNHLATVNLDGGGGGGGAGGPLGAGAAGGSSGAGGGPGGGGNGGGTVGGGTSSSTGAAGGNNAAGSGGGTGGAVGNNGSDGTNGGGGGGGANSHNGGLGGAGTEWDASHGSGGGGGGGGGGTGSLSSGGNAALYGAGGGANGANQTTGAHGTGAQGIIVVTYTPAVSVFPFVRRNIVLRRQRWQRIENAKLFRRDWRDIKPWVGHKDIAEIIKQLDSSDYLWDTLTELGFGLTGNQPGIEYSYRYSEFEDMLFAAGNYTQMEMAA